MTLSPVEIARKVLEAGEKMRSGPAFKSISVPMPTDVCVYLGLVANGAEALARAVIELSAENERRRVALVRIASSAFGPTGRALGWEDAALDMQVCAREALAALSPTEGDGRKETNDGK